MGQGTIRGLQPSTPEGRITDFSDVVLPARALSFSKGSNASEIITANPDCRVMIYAAAGGRSRPLHVPGDGGGPALS